MRLANHYLKIRLVSVISSVVLLCLLPVPQDASKQTTNLPVAFNGFGGTGPLYLGQDARIFKKQSLTLEMIAVQISYKFRF